MQAVWREELKQLEMNNLNLQANDSSLKGQASVILEAKPKWVLNLQFDKLNRKTCFLRLRRALRTTIPRSSGKTRETDASGYLV